MRCTFVEEGAVSDDCALEIAAPLSRVYAEIMRAVHAYYISDTVFIHRGRLELLALSGLNFEEKSILESSSENSSSAHLFRDNRYY